MDVITTRRRSGLLHEHIAVSRDAGVRETKLD